MAVFINHNLPIPIPKTEATKAVEEKARVVDIPLFESKRQIKLNKLIQEYETTHISLRGLRKRILREIGELAREIMQEYSAE